MKYTEEEKQALSRSVAEKFDIEMEYAKNEWGDLDTSCPMWLHDDWNTICELCNKRKIYARYSHDGLRMVAMVAAETLKQLSSVEIYDCNNDPSLAERIARLLALAEV